MQNSSRYTAYTPDSNGYIHYTTKDNQVWKILYDRQTKLIQNRACEEYLAGLKKLKLSSTKISQPQEVSQNLMALTGWSVEPVESIISFRRFFDLLAQRVFPAASFIRRMEDLDYLPEPDIFHELFGHGPALTDSIFAEFTHQVGLFSKSLPDEDLMLLARLYWFTVEFGLINTSDGLRIYGAGIVSSNTESVYSLEDPIPLRKDFNLLEVLRTPYRYDQMQKIYFVIDSFDHLYKMIEDKKLLAAFDQAKKLGMLPSLYTDNDSEPVYNLEKN